MNIVGEDYNGGHNSGTPEEILNVLGDYNILVAYESVGDYGWDSSSWFLLKNKTSGEYFEFCGGHCSCYGFEGQFELEETSLEYLKSSRWKLSTCGSDDYSDNNCSSVKKFISNL